MNITENQNNNVSQVTTFGVLSQTPTGVKQDTTCSPALENNTAKMLVLLRSMSLSERKILFSEMEGEKSKVTVLEDRRKTFQDLLSQWGYKSHTNFLIECEFITNPSVKKTRMVISKDVRPKIVEDLRLGTLTNQEVSKKYGVTVDVIYSYRKKYKIPTLRTKKDPTTTSVPDGVTTVQTSTVNPTTDNPTSVPTTTPSVSDQGLIPSVV